MKKIEQLKEDLSNAEGLGDSIKALTKLLNITTCEDCEARRIKFNKMFPFNRRAERELTEEEVEYIQSIQKSKMITDTVRFINLFNDVFNAKEKVTTCASCMIGYLEKLALKVEYDSIGKN